MHERLAFIASRRRGIETYYFAHIPEPMILEPVGRRWRFQLLEYPTRAEAFRDMLTHASFRLERQSLR